MMCVRCKNKPAAGYFFGGLWFVGVLEMNGKVQEDLFCQTCANTMMDLASEHARAYAETQCIWEDWYAQKMVAEHNLSTEASVARFRVDDVPDLYSPNAAEDTAGQLSLPDKTE